MSMTNAEDQMKPAKRVVRQRKSTHSSDPAEQSPVAPPAPPREIVVYCEGFGAGPGCGWFIEASFVELNQGGFSVFLRTDEDLYEDDSVEVGALGEDALDNETSDGSMRARRIATIKKPLTWRRVLQFASRRACLRITDEGADIQIRGVEPWQRDVIASAMIRGNARRTDSLASFLSGLPDEDLQSLHDRFGGLLSEEAHEVLPELADWVLHAELEGKSLREIVQLVGVADPWEFDVLTEAVAAYGEVVEARRVEHLVAKFIAEHSDQPTAIPFQSLTERRSTISTIQRAELFAMWLRTEPKPQGGRIGSVNCSGSVVPVLNWLLHGHVADVFSALDDDHRSELEQFALWFLREARPHAHVYHGHPMRRGLHSVWAKLGPEVQEAADQLGLPIPDEVRLPPIPLVQP